MMDTVVRVAVSLLPIPAFLAVLRMLDSYKLLTLRRTLENILAGAVVAGVCYGINSAAFAVAGPSYAHYGAPVLEECLKAVWLIWLIRSHRVGFMVDAAISGFAIGAGFALVENISYLVHFAGAS